MKWKELGFKILDGLTTGSLTVRKLEKQVVQRINELFPGKYQGDRRDELRSLVNEIAWDYYGSDKRITARYYLEVLQDIEKTNVFI
jgi:hypothetical protein